MIKNDLTAKALRIASNSDNIERYEQVADILIDAKCLRKENEKLRNKYNKCFVDRSVEIVQLKGIVRDLEEENEKLRKYNAIKNNEISTISNQTHRRLK